MITTWNSGPADSNMPQSMLVQTLARVRSHPWWLARARLALALLSREQVCPPSNVIDVGCGWGVTLQALEGAGYNTSGLDISPQILQEIDRPERKLIEADLTRNPPDNLKPWDALLALDVLEHVDDDGGFIKRLSLLLRPGGFAIISVPALPELFSDFDHIQGHRRRYLPQTLRAAFEGSDLQLKSVFWWGAWMVPLLSRRRSARGTARKTYADYLKLPPWPGPLVMTLLYRLEHPKALKGKLTRGTSLFAIATKQA